MSPKYVSYLERLIDIPYSKLTEEEKDSDREEVRKYWKLIIKGGNNG